MPYDRNKPTDEYRDASSFLEEVLHGFQFFLIQKEIFSESSDERFSSVISYRIRYQRSDDTSHRTDYYDSSKTELFRRYQKSRERHDGFARHRKDHTLQHHSDEDSDISCLMDERRDIGCKEFCDSHTI